MKTVHRIEMGAAQNEKVAKALREEGGRLLGYIRKQVQDIEDAEDIFQDTFSQLSEAYLGLEQIERVTSWLFRVAKNKIADFYRKKGRKESNLGSQVSIPDAGIMDLLPSQMLGPEDEMQREAFWLAIEAALDQLPQNQREVFVWHEFEEISFKEIAAWTGETENTLRLRKYNAVQNLRRLLASLYQEMLMD
jgi:RNA polymerase sigma factor (sigma-70 family)